MDPEEIEQKEFSNSLRGYDRAEVDSFAAEVAQEIRDYKRRLEAAQRSARDAIAKAEEAALQKEVPAAPVVTERSSLYQEIGHETARILETAEQVAADIKNRASSQSAEILADAHRDSALIAQEAKAGRRDLEEELRRLKQTRAMLAAELEDVRRRITESVSRLQVPIEQARPRQAAPTPPAGSTSATAPAPAAHSGPPERPTARDQAGAPVEAAPLAKGVPEQSASAQVAPAQPGPPPAKSAQPARLQDAPVQPAPGPALPADPGLPQATPQGPIPEEPAPASRVDPSQQNEILPPDRSASPSDKPAAAHDRTNGNSNGNGHQVKVEDDVVERLLREIREEGDASGAAVTNPQSRAPRRQTPRAQTPAQTDSVSPPEEEKAAPTVAPASEAQRTKALGTGPADASRRLKRLLQEDQNDLLHRLRLQRGKGTVEDNIYSEQEQFDRFNESLFEVLASAFAKGRKAGGGKGGSDAGARIHGLLSKQVVNPLRSELVKVIEAGLAAGDTPTAIADRASDVYRVWKGVRTEMLGEGIVFAAFNLGLLEAWASNRTATKLWVVSPEETQCPGEVCQRNAAGGAIAVGEAFESGHLSPPAHGGCTCSLAAE